MNRNDTIDETDKDIMRMLQKDARLSFRSIAKALNLSTGTVSQRVRRLTDMGAIKRFSAIINPEMLGKRYTMLVMIRSRAGAQLDEVVAQIEALDESCCIHTITGDFHLQVIVRLTDTHSAAQFLETVRNLPGVEFVTSFVVLKSYKPFYEVSI